jgi:hypothetical protein
MLLEPLTSTLHYVQAISNNVGAQIICHRMHAFVCTFHVQRHPTFAKENLV